MRLEADLRESVDLLQEMTNHYAGLANSGDAGFWDPRKEKEVKAAREFIAKHSVKP